MASSNQGDSKGEGKALLPEMQIKVFEALVTMHCPIICLRSQEQIEEIISDLIDDSNVTNNADEYVRLEVEKATWRCAYMRPDFEFVDNSPRKCIEVRPRQKIQQFMGNIRRLELGLSVSPNSLATGLYISGLLNVVDATTAIGSLKAQLPRLTTFIVFLDVGLDYMKDEVAKTSVWWDELAIPVKGWYAGFGYTLNGPEANSRPGVRVDLTLR